MVAVCTGTKVRHMHSPGIWVDLSRDHLQGPTAHTSGNLLVVAATAERDW